MAASFYFPSKINPVYDQPSGKDPASVNASSDILSLTTNADPSIFVAVESLFCGIFTLLSTLHKCNFRRLVYSTVSFILLHASMPLSLKKNDL